MTIIIRNKLLIGPSPKHLSAPSPTGLGIGTGLLVTYEMFVPIRHIVPRLIWIVMDSKDVSKDPVHPRDVVAQLREDQRKL